MPILQLTKRLLVVLVAGLALSACTSAPDTSRDVGASQPTASGTETGGPAPAPTPRPAATATPQAESAGASVSGDATSSMSGNWSGTVVESTGSQGIRFVLLQVGETISGDVVYEHGKVDNGVTGTRDGDSVMLVYEARSTELTTTYEGTVSGGTFSGTVSRQIGGQSAPGGTFEVTRE